MFLNPFSGKKKAVKVYREKVLPLFELADLKIELIGKFLHTFFYLVFTFLLVPNRCLTEGDYRFAFGLSICLFACPYVSPSAKT